MGVAISIYISVGIRHVCFYYCVLVLVHQTVGMDTEVCVGYKGVDVDKQLVFLCPVYQSMRANGSCVGMG